MGGGRAVEEVEVVGAVLDAVPEDIDGATLGDLALEAGEELAAGGAVLVEAEGGGGVGLGGVEEGAELDEVDAVLAVVVVVVAGGPVDAAVGAGGVRRRCGRMGGSQGSPVRAWQMRRSRPRSVRSVVMGGMIGQRDRASPEPWYRLLRGLPRVSSAPKGSTSGSEAAASRTSSFPVTTSAINRVRYSRSKSIWQR